MLTDLSEQVRQVALDAGASLVGFAPVSRFENAPPENHPWTVFPQTKTAIAIALPQPRGALKAVEEGCFWQAYNCDAYWYLNEVEAPRILRRIIMFLEEQGYTSVPFHNPFHPHSGRQIREDHALGEIFTLQRPLSGSPALFDESRDASFVAACRELLGDRVFLEQQDRGRLLGSRRMKWHDASAWGGKVPGDSDKWVAGKAYSFFTRPDGMIVGVSKMGWVTTSADNGNSWSQPVVPPTLVTRISTVPPGVVAGMITVRVVSLTMVNVAETPPTVTAVVVRKPEPVTVTLVPTGPLAGLTLVTTATLVPV
jgi:hypothetical protein